MVHFHLPDYPPTHTVSDFEFLHDLKDEHSKLGTGSFANVKLAREKSSGKLLALKIVDISKITDTDLHNLKSEILIHKELNHPNIIKFHGYIHSGDQVYIVLDYASHGNLYNYLQCKKKLTEKEVFRFFHQACLATNYIHQKNILHRDIKPENLLLDDDFNIKVCDFGWAAHNINQQRTTFCGTFEYMAPEIIREETYDYRVDIWALGVLLFELIHNRPPYKGRTLSEIKSSLAKNYIVFDEKINPEVKLLIVRTLDYNPNNRIAIDNILTSRWINEHVEREINFRKSVYQGDIVGRASRLTAACQKLKIFDEDAEPVSQSSQSQWQLRSMDMNNKSTQQLLSNTVEPVYVPITKEKEAEKERERENVSNQPTTQPAQKRVSRVATLYSVPTDLMPSCSDLSSPKQAASPLSILFQEGIISDVPRPVKTNITAGTVKKKRIFDHKNDENLLSPQFNRQLDKIMGTLSTRQQTDYPLKNKDNFNSKSYQFQSMRSMTEYGTINNRQTHAQELTISNAQSFSRLMELVPQRDGITSLGGSPRIIFQETNITNQKKKSEKSEGFSLMKDVKSLFDKVNILTKCRRFEKPSRAAEAYVPSTYTFENI